MLHEFLNKMATLSADDIYFAILLVITTMTMICFIYNSKKLYTAKHCCCPNNSWTVSFVTILISIVVFGSKLAISLITEDISATIMQVGTAFDTAFIAFELLPMMLFYVAIIIRVYETSKGLFHRPIKKSNMYCLTLLLCILLIAWMSALAMRHNSTKIGSYVWFSAITTIAISDLVLNIMILYLFIRKLSQELHELDNSDERLLHDKRTGLSGRSHEAITKQNTSNDDREKMEYKLSNNVGNQHEAVDMMIKIIILTIFCEIWQHIWLWIYIFTALKFTVLGNEKGMIADMGNSQAQFIIWFCQFGSIAVYCIVLHLAMVFSDQQYMFLCCLCHSALKSCLEKRISNKTSAQLSN